MPRRISRIQSFLRVPFKASAKKIQKGCIGALDNIGKRFSSRVAFDAFFVGDYLRHVVACVGIAGEEHALAGGVLYDLLGWDSKNLHHHLYHFYFILTWKKRLPSI